MTYFCSEYRWRPPGGARDPPGHVRHQRREPQVRPRDFHHPLPGLDPGQEDEDEVLQTQVPGHVFNLVHGLQGVIGLWRLPDLVVWRLFRRSSRNLEQL